MWSPVVGIWICKGTGRDKPVPYGPFLARRHSLKPAMLQTLAVANYRSLRDLVLPLESLNLVTGANGSGKSNLYKGLRLLSETAFGTAVESLAAEGGIESVLWAGPEQFSKGVKRGDYAVQGGPRKKPVNLRFGFAGDDFSYAIDYGLPEPMRTMFGKDSRHQARGHLARRVVAPQPSDGGPARTPWYRRGMPDGNWQVIEKHLPTFDSMLSRLADPERAPEVLMLRERIRSWRFYDHFRSDASSPARTPQVGTRTPVLANDGRDLAAAWQTIVETGEVEALNDAVADAFPGATVGRRGLRRPVQPPVQSARAAAAALPSRTVRRHAALPALDRRPLDAASTESHGAERTGNQSAPGSPSGAWAADETLCAEHAALGNHPRREP